MPGPQTVMIVRILGVVLLFGGASAFVTQAPETIAPVVGGYEQLRRAGGVDDRILGEVLLGELNCLSCHRVSDPARNGISERISTKPAPDLSGVAGRVTAAWMRRFLNDPHTVKPGATMPDVLHALTAQERRDTVERITHFLMQTGADPDALEYRPFRFRAAVERGRALFHRIGCVACHAPEASAAPPQLPSVPLDGLADKTSVEPLVEFLRQPTETRAGGRMPFFYLSEPEAADLALYLLRGQEPPAVRRIPGFEFEYFFDPVVDVDPAAFLTRPPPDFDDLIPEATGRIEAISLELPVPTRRNNHLFRFSGLITVAQTATYSFVLQSDRPSGSGLAIDGRTVATKDRDSGRIITAEVDLDAGDHRVEATYYLRGGSQEPYLTVTVAGGVIAEPTPLGRFATIEDVRLAPPSDGPFEPDPELARQGARLFREVGCSACHALAGAAAGAAPRTPAPALDRLDMERLTSDGPLHGTVGAPRYGLSSHQRRTIRAALAAIDELARPRPPAEQVVHTLATYNCYACHARRDALAEAGGLEPRRAAYFEVIGGIDLGDEGRIPPSLTGVGGKLKGAALRSILTEDGLHVRGNFMHARMPRFAGTPLNSLPQALTDVDDPLDAPAPPLISDVAVNDGRTLVGSDGLRCITCHDVGNSSYGGVSTINLTTVYERLRPDWVARLLRDPHAINEDTRMPAFWSGGSVMHPDIAGGTVEGQIAAINAYLSLGASMPVPEGMLAGAETVLVPDEEPILFRTFMLDASPRSIVVGYPESVHVGFDANVMRLATAWRGAFFDAGGTWRGRAGQFFAPYGEDIVAMPPGPALAVLDSIEQPWPPVRRTDRNVGGRFLGYRLDDQRRPVFMYRLGDIVVEEQPLPVVSAGGTNLLRRFSLEAGRVSGDLYLLLGEGDEIVENADGSWTIDGAMRVAVRSGAATAPFVRSSQGVRQLLVPVAISDNQQVTLEVEISW